jgi:hypothetical protein
LDAKTLPARLKVRIRGCLRPERLTPAARVFLSLPSQTYLWIPPSFAFTPAYAAACLTLFLSFGVPLDIMAAIDIQSLSQLLQLSLDPRSNKQGGWICRLLCPGGCITAPPHC